jgi:hypothetical protein
VAHQDKRLAALLTKPTVFQENFNGCELAVQARIVHRCFYVCGAKAALVET